MAGTLCAEKWAFKGQHKGRASSIRSGSDGQPGIEPGAAGGWRPQEHEHGAVLLLRRSLPLQAGFPSLPWWRAVGSDPDFALCPQSWDSM